MIDIIKIATFLEDKLNQNLSGFTFRVYTFEKTLDNRYERDEKDSPYEITPAIITTPVGSYLPMNQMRGMRLSFNLETLIPLSKKENWIEMINEFVWSVNGKVFYLKDTLTETIPSKPYQTVKITCQVPSFGVVGPSQFTTIQQISQYLPIKTTEDYITVNIPISMNTIEGFMVGDERKIYLAEASYPDDYFVVTTKALFDEVDAKDKITIPAFGPLETESAVLDYYNANPLDSRDYPFSAFCYSHIGGTKYYYRNFARPFYRTFYEIITPDFATKNTKVQVSEHFIGELTATSIPAANGVDFIMTAYVEKNYLFRTLLSNQFYGVNQTKKYWLKTEMPVYGDEDTDIIQTDYAKVIIKDTSGIHQIGDYSIVPLVLTRGWKE